MKKPMLNCMQKVKMYYKKPKMSYEKPKFNPKLKAAAKAGKLDNNPKFKAAVEKAKMYEKPMMTRKASKAHKKMDQALAAKLAGNEKKAVRKGKAGIRKGVKAGILSKAEGGQITNALKKPKLSQEKVDRKKKAIERKVSKFKKTGAKSDARKAKAVGKKMRKIGQLEKGETLTSVDGVKPKMSKSKLIMKGSKDSKKALKNAAKNKPKMAMKKKPKMALKKPKFMKPFQLNNPGAYKF